MQGKERNSIFSDDVIFSLVIIHSYSCIQCIGSRRWGQDTLNMVRGGLFMLVLSYVERIALWSRRVANFNHDSKCKFSSFV